MLGLVTPTHVHRREIPENEFNAYLDYLASEFLDDLDMPLTKKEELVCDLFVTFHYRKDIYFMLQKFHFLISMIWSPRKEEIGKVDESGVDDPLPIENLDEESILAFFIGCTHWILSDKQFWEKNKDPQQQFINYVRKQLCPSIDHERMLDMIHLLDYLSEYEDTKIRAYELIGINRLIMENQDPNEYFYDDDLDYKNFQKKNK